MDINDYRKKIFLNSQYCNYYNVNNNTVLAGIMRSNGYRYSVRLPEEKLQQISKTYRKFTTIMNSVVALEIILYIYFVIFPFYTEFMKLPFFAVVILLSLIPMVALFLTYVALNYLYENYLSRYVGTFQRMKFKPEIRHIDEKMFKEYEKTPRKSVYILVLMAVIFFLYLFTPFAINSLNNNGKYPSAVKLSNTYLTFMPIAPEIYAQRAYAKYNMKQYKDAVEDYQKANDYSLSDNFSDDILGVKTYYIPYKQMLDEFDNAIALETLKPAKYYLMSEKAAYQLKHKDYKSAYSTFNYLINLYNKGQKVYFSPVNAYYNRGLSRAGLGDVAGAKHDCETAKKMCPDCKFSLETTLIRKPL